MAGYKKMVAHDGSTVLIACEDEWAAGHARAPFAGKGVIERDISQSSGQGAKLVLYCGSVRSALTADASGRWAIPMRSRSMGMAGVSGVPGCDRK